MVFLTCMVSILLTNNLGKAGVVYGFILALSMEVINQIIMAKIAKKAEDVLRRRFSRIIDGYKERELAFEESTASTQRSTEALERQLQDYIDNVNALEKTLREREIQVNQYRDTVERQEKIIAAATKPAWD